MPATFTKLKSGEYGIRAEGTLSVGQSVTVTKRDGSTSRVVVKKILWSGRDRDTGRTVTLAAIEQDRPSNESRSSGYGSQRQSTVCPRCGGDENNQVECSYCA